MTDLTTTITIDNTDHTITIDDNEDTITHTGYMHYNEELNIYLIISYKTRGAEVLETNVHEIGTKPSLTTIPNDSINHERIRNTIEDELGYRITDEQLETITEAYRHAGPQNVDDWGLYPTEMYREIDSSGYISTNIEHKLNGWDHTTKSILDDLDYHPDDEYNIINTIFEAVRTNTPGDHEYVAKLETGDIDAWRVRALELFQHSVLGNKPQLCKIQALREAGHDYFEISNILDTHSNTISHQLSDIDEWLESANWTAQNVTND